jgi:hypothetical protein
MGIPTAIVCYTACSGAKLVASTIASIRQSEYNSAIRE